MAVNMIAFTMTPQEIQQLSAQFLAMDENNNGQISKEELTKAWVERRQSGAAMHRS